jgi:hypothetical protein
MLQASKEKEENSIIFCRLGKYFVHVAVIKTGECFQMLGRCMHVNLKWNESAGEERVSREIS